VRELTEITGAFLKLGLISFGGPVAHLGYLREEFVTRRRWLSDDAYGDLVALCQFLPGPASSQAVFALGMQRAGWLGGLLASLSFTLPSAVLMILFGHGVVVMDDLQAAGWVHGLKLAAVAVVAQAVWGMGRSLCPDRARVSIGLGAAVVLLVFPGARTQIGVIAVGMVTGWWLYRGTPAKGKPEKWTDGNRHLTAAATLMLFLLLLLGLPWLAVVTGYEAL
jgi:chromate transporter